jgi:pyrimidine-nucleoside phosphorylase
MCLKLLIKKPFSYIFPVFFTVPPISLSTAKIRGGEWIFSQNFLIIACRNTRRLKNMRAVDIIRKKRDGERLSKKEISFFIDNFVKGDIPDYQMTAFLMAVYFRSMDFEETTHLTDSMMRSGTVLDFSDIPVPKVDKHSTGGVGDKISLPLAPLVASCGVAVPMISGRALGHTGGTLDKLESIPDFRTDLSPDEFHKAIEKVGVAIIGQTEDIVPADRRMYALRDVTATVESIPLIASSIMSKKLAEDILSN